MHHRVRTIRNARGWQRLNWLNHFRRNDRGIQLAEVAIVLPIMIMLFGAVAEFGRYFYEYTTVAKAARLGARYMTSKSLDSATTSWETKAKNLVVYGNAAGTGSPVLIGLTTNNVTITYSGGTYVGGNGVPEKVTVSIVNFKHQPIFDLAKLTKSSFSMAIDVKPSVTMHYLLNSGSV
ncbi:MAG: TadE/TadG family type IV pilus assembly protein [Pyrinomonadaceae bacterium]